MPRKKQSRKIEPATLKASGAASGPKRWSSGIVAKINAASALTMPGFHIPGAGLSN